MTFDLYIALLSFAFISVITPGPNNLMLMASGLNFGWRRSIPHMLGVGLGFPLMLLLVGLGLMQVFVAYPIVRQIMTVCSIFYLLYLAWKIANAAPASSGAEVGKPLTLFQATAFQWVNPKAWSMALTALSVYVPADMGWHGAVLAALTYVICGIISTNTWTLLGIQIKRLLRNDFYQRVFNWACASVLVLTLYPAVSDYLK
jgi:threonine/homoserine/homoserine lactone efflux protein